MAHRNRFIRHYVKIACEKTIAEIIDRRKAKIERIIAGYMEPRKKFGFFGKMVTRTRKEAQIAADNDEYRFAMYHAENYAWRSEDFVSRLLQSASAQEGEDTYLSADEFSCISNHYPKREA